MQATTAERKQSIESSHVWCWLQRRADAHILLALGLITFVAFANSLGNRFVYDDHALIETNHALRDWRYFATAFTRSFSYDVTWIDYSSMTINYYRPFTRILFGLAFQAFGLQPGYWHLLNITIFIGVVMLAYIVIKQLSGRRIVAAIGAFLFAVHPIHSEPVAWVDGLVETMHALFFFGGFALYLYAEAEGKTRRGRIFFFGSLALLLAALLSKETALCFPILVAAYKFIHTKSSFMRRVLAGTRTATPFLLVVAVYFVLRYFAYGSLQLTSNTLPLNIVLLTVPSVILEYLRMLVLPLGLSLVHNVPKVTSLAGLKFWIPLLLLVISAVLIWARASRRAAFASAWIMITMLPVLNIGLFSEDLMMQDRYAFLPSLGFCTLVAMALGALLERESVPALQLILPTFLIAAIIGLLGLTVRQNSFWHDDISLWARASAVNPNSEFSQCSYGAALINNGRMEEAAHRFTLSFQMKSGNSGCGCLGLGTYYASRGDHDQAIQFYERAIDLGMGESYMFAFTNLAHAYSKKGQNDKAIELLEKTVAAHPDFQQARSMLEHLKGSNSPNKN